MAESNILEIIQGLAQAAANVYDGSHDERYVRDGEAKKVGLKREEGCPIMDKRVMDGFNVKFYGNQICIKYQSFIHLQVQQSFVLMSSVYSVTPLRLFHMAYQE